MFTSKRKPRGRQENANPRCVTAVRMLDNSWRVERSAARELAAMRSAHEIP
jgi:hypothetical protein